jgi:hypothetical protein
MGQLKAKQKEKERVRVSITRVIANIIVYCKKITVLSDVFNESTGVLDTTFVRTLLFTVAFQRIFSVRAPRAAFRNVSVTVLVRTRRCL